MSPAETMLVCRMIAWLDRKGQWLHVMHEAGKVKPWKVSWTRKGVRTTTCHDTLCLALVHLMDILDLTRDFELDMPTHVETRDQFGPVHSLTIEGLQPDPNREGF